MRDAAVFTMLHDVNKMFSVWLRYYQRWFEPQDIYVLGHGLRGDIKQTVTAGANQGYYNLLPVHHDHSYDARWMTSTATEFQRFLLRSYRVVVFSAVDEIVAFAGKGGLRQYLANAPTVARCRGYEVVHRREQEGPLTFESPVLAQRRWWYESQRYSKPLIGQVPIYWHPGFSTAANLVDREGFAKDLYVLHLHKVDFDFVVHRHRTLAAARWHPPELRGGLYLHNRLEDPEQLAAWLRLSADMPSQECALTEIPEKLRTEVTI